MTVLHYAAATGEAAVLHALLEARIDPDVDDACQGSTALHYAASEGHWRSAAMLIDAAADVNWENDYLRTPLAHAAEGGYTTICELLLSRGATMTADEHQL